MHFRRGAVTVTAVAVWFSDSYIEKVPWEHYVLLRKHINRRCSMEVKLIVMTNSDLQSTHFTNL